MLRPYRFPRLRPAPHPTGYLALPRMASHHPMRFPGNEVVDGRAEVAHAQALPIPAITASTSRDGLPGVATHGLSSSHALPWERVTCLSPLRQYFLHGQGTGSIDVTPTGFHRVGYCKR